jgi:hypothetical protein
VGPRGKLGYGVAYVLATMTRTTLWGDWRSCWFAGRWRFFVRACRFGHLLLKGSARRGSCVGPGGLLEAGWTGREAFGGFTRR